MNTSVSKLLSPDSESRDFDISTAEELLSLEFESSPCSLECKDGQKKKNKQRLTKHTHKTKDRVTRIPLKTEGDSGAPEEWTVSAPLMTIIHAHAYYKTIVCSFSFGHCVVCSSSIYGF
jgi:hypothetical protein